MENIMKKLINLLGLTGLAATAALCVSCAIYSVKPTKVCEVEGEVTKRYVYKVEFIDNTKGQRIILEPECKTLFEMQSDDDTLYWGLHGVQGGVRGDSIEPCIMHGDSVKVFFGENPEVLYMMYSISVPRTEKGKEKLEEKRFLVPDSYEIKKGKQKSFW
jgi:hypothetical protein